MDRRRAGASSVTPLMVAEANKSSKSFPGRQRETAEYLADMILEFRNLARSMQLYTVMVPLEYAYYEAFGFANKVEVPPHEIERIKLLAKAGEEMDGDPERSDI